MIAFFDSYCTVIASDKFIKKSTNIFPFTTYIILTTYERLIKKKKEKKEKTTNEREHAIDTKNFTLFIINIIFLFIINNM